LLEQQWKKRGGKCKTGYRVKANFQIGLHRKDLALLEQIQLFFGVGKISKLGAESVQFRVYALEDLKVILHHFDKYPLLTNKQSDYLLFKQVPPGPQGPGGPAGSKFNGTRKTFDFRRFK
jgi:LAGLIDADG endonuclease